MATHAFVLMLRGLTIRWKKVVAYYFTGDSFSAEQIKKIILEIFTKASECNFKVLNVTMDMGGGNQAKVCFGSLEFPAKFEKQQMMMEL